MRRVREVDLGEREVVREVAEGWVGARDVSVVLDDGDWMLLCRAPDDVGRTVGGTGGTDEGDDIEEARRSREKVRRCDKDLSLSSARYRTLARRTYLVHLRHLRHPLQQFLLLPPHPLPSRPSATPSPSQPDRSLTPAQHLGSSPRHEIGRASCRERVS